MARIWYLQLTRVCNHKCVFCSNPANWRFLTKDEIISWLNELKKDGYTDVIFTWWEPTLHPDIFTAISYAKKIWLVARIITNWSKIADMKFLQLLIGVGLDLIHLSVYSYKKDLNIRIRGYSNAYIDMVKSLVNTYKLNVPVQITTVIFKDNQDHLLKTVLFIKKINPTVSHFVWNILDPEMMPPNWKKNKDKILPDLWLAGRELLKCFDYLTSIGNTFRVEKMPLCFIPWYERANTECRKIVKEDSRKVIFLDFRGHFAEKWKMFQHDFADICNRCILKNICWWIFWYKKWYNPKLLPVTQSIDYLNNIIKKIKWNN